MYTYPMNPKPIVLIDAYALLHRGYHAFPQLSTPEGFPTGALYGFSAMIMRIIEKYDPQDVLVCFDILPFDAMRVGLIVTSFGSVFLLSKKKNINSQNSKMSIAGCCTLLIWTISIFTAFFIQK